MSKKDQLIAALNEPKLLTTQGHLEALNALLSAGNNISSFRNALKQHKAFWKKFDGLSCGEDDDFYKDNDELLVVGDLAALIQQTAHKRVLAGLKSAPEAALASLIEAGTADVLRVKLNANKTAFGLTIPDPTQQNLIANEVRDDIQLQAQRALLERKIKESTRHRDPEKILVLLDKLNARDDAQFIAAVKGLTNNISTASADKMTSAGVGNLIKSDLAVECFLLNSSNEFSNHYSINPSPGKLNIIETLQKDGAEFLRDLPPRYRENIDISKADTIKGILGEHFLTASIVRNKEANFLKKIANAPTADELQDVLKDLDVDDKFLKHSVNNAKLPIYRHLAAERLLALKIAEGISTESLSMLAEAENYPAFLTALEVSPDLGFADNQELRNAFITTEYDHIKGTVKTAAHVALNLRTADVNKVSNFIAARDVQAFANQYNTDFQVNATEKNLFKAHFNNPENLIRAREQALVTVFKSKLLNVPLGQVEAVANSADANILQDHVANILGSRVANDLIIGDVNVKGTAQLLRAHAKAEQIYQQALDSDLANPDDFDLIINKINELDMEDETDTNLIKSLPLPDQNIFKTDLATFLVRSCPADRAPSLAKIVSAKNIADFNQALGELGITQYDWVNAKSMEIVQKGAAAGAIALKIDEASPRGAAARPALLKLLSDFPLAKQQALLANSSIIPAVLNATSIPELGRILNISEAVLRSNKSLRTEYDRIILSKKIDNANIGIILASLPSIELDEKKINEINKLLTEKRKESFINEIDFIEKLVEPIKNIVKPADEISFHEAFGLNAEGVRAEAENDVEGIDEQHRFNRKIFKAIDALNSTDPQLPCAHFFASLPKVVELTTPQIENNLWEAFEKAKSRDELIQKIEGNRAHPIDEKFLDILKKELTPKKYNELKRPFAQAKFLDRATSTQLLQENATVLKTQGEHLQKIAETDKTVRKELKRLAALDTTDWLNPAFQAATKQKAHQLEPHFKELATTCDIIVDQLKHQKDELQDQWLSLPDRKQVESATLSATQKKAIEDHRNELLQRNKEIKSEYELYSNLQKVLNGNPDNTTEFGQKGVLRIVEEAKNPKQEIKFLGYASTYQDYPLSKKSDHLDAGWVGKEADAVQDTVANAGKSYEAAPDYLKVEPGYFREYTIGKGADTGHFIEERGTNDLAPRRVDGKVEYTPSIKLTMNKFPADQPRTPVAAHNARVAFCMAMSAQLLASVDKKPTEKDPIVLSGSDPVKLRYLWTALQASGVSHKAIKVVSTAFNPSQYLSFFGGYDDNFEVAQDTKLSFKNNPAVIQLQKTLDELKKDKSISEGELKGITENLIKTTKTFKEKLVDTKDLKKIADDNKKMPSTPRLK